MLHLDIQSEFKLYIDEYKEFKRYSYLDRFTLVNIILII